MRQTSSEMKPWLLPMLAVLLAALACGPADTLRELAGGVFRTYYVAPDGDDDSDCRSWEHACLTVRGAVELADGGDTVRIAAGTVETLEAQIDKSLAIIGMGEEATMLEWGYPAALAINNTVVLSDLSITNWSDAESNSRCISVTESGSVQAERVTLRNCAIGIYVLPGGEAILEQVTITGSVGEAIYSEGGTVTIRESHLIENKGSALGNTGTMIVEDTTIDRNLLDPLPVGGDLPMTSISNAGHLELIRSTISRSMQRGISNNGELLLINSTVSLNHDLGISSQDGLVSLRNVTVAENGGVGIGNTGGLVEIENSIVSGNANNCGWSALSFPSVSGINLSEDCRYFTEVEVLLGPLADNGGPTETHALLPGSPAVDAALVDCLPEDQRGVERPLGVSCDVGAFELDPALASEPFALSAPGAAMDLPQATIVDDGLCWAGPGAGYPIVNSLSANTLVSLRGMGQRDGWLVIDSPRFPGVDCWLDLENIELPPDLDLAGLIIFPVPPLPTATSAPGCRIYDESTINDLTDTICVPRACTLNDQPAGSCTP